jgi:hypothetical protein
VAAAYFMVAVFLFICAKKSEAAEPGVGPDVGDPAMVPAE